MQQHQLERGSFSSAAAYSPYGSNSIGGKKQTNYSIYVDFYLFLSNWILKFNKLAVDLQLNYSQNEVIVLAINYLHIRNANLQFQLQFLLKVRSMSNWYYSKVDAFFSS